MKLQDYKAKYEALPHKKNLSGDEAMRAVKENGYALQYVKDQTEEICLEAVKENGYALQYVDSTFFETSATEDAIALLEKNGYKIVKS